jgi:hypothetical protein
MNSSVNCRRVRRPVLLDPILDIVSALRKMSTKLDQAHVAVGTTKKIGRHDLTDVIR